MAPDRPPFTDSDLLGGPEKDDEAFRTSNGYFGKYVTERDVVRYDIEVAQVPKMVGEGHIHAHLESVTNSG
jgi:hypothetical protein